MGDDSRTTSTTVTREADRAISASDGATGVVAGGPISYAIEVSNAGPSTATNATVTDTFPAEITGVAWTCAPTGGAICGAPAGNGAVKTTVSLPPGGKATFSASGTVAANAGDDVSADGYQHGVGDPNTYFVAADAFEVRRGGRRVR